MGFEDNSNTKQKKVDTTIRNLHLLLFLIHFFIVIFMILLLILGIGSSCCTLIFIILLLLNISYYWYRRKIERIKREELATRYSSNLEIINIPKVYEFYCPRCLYQTNEDVEYCPNCEIGVLSPTTKNRERLIK